MWDTYNEDRSPRANIGKIVRLSLIAAFVAIIFAIASNQSANLLMNLAEFGATFTKPLYYSIISGLFLAAIAVVRVNIRDRHSMTWYAISVIVRFIDRSRQEARFKTPQYSEFKMSKASFTLWQLTKVLLFAPLFSSIIFGMTLAYVAQGNDIGLSSIARIFLIPFSNVPMDGSYARQNVIPMLPGLTLLLPPILNAVGIRLFLYVGISGAADIATRYAIDKKEGKPKFLSYISDIEVIAGVAILWTGFNMFFSSIIDYNTRYSLSIMIALGITLVAYGFLDRKHARIVIYPTRKLVYLRVGSVVIATALAASIMSVNNSIADTKKIDWYGPYIAQEIAVNRYIHGLDQIQTLQYNIKQPSTSPSIMQSTLSQNSGLLSNIRLWDQTNAKLKLSHELGQRNDISYVDTDIVRFGGRMYWAAAASPVIPEGIAQQEKWFNQHMVYTHSDAGVKILEANTGNVIDQNQFFKQYQMYYGESGESGVFSKFWSSFPVDRKQSFELGGYFYNGTGGVDISPPLSWMFDPNFILYDTTAPMHVMRYKDIHDRMQFLYPYFAYEFSFGGGTLNNPQFKKIEAVPVTDGGSTYWLMPLIVALDTSKVPWSSPPPSSFMLNLVGFALIDAYNGSVKILVTGTDYFSQIFLEQYKDIGATRDVPDWLQDQITYPKEMFMWKISKFNTYHITDPKAYLQAAGVYAIPVDSSSQELSPYYVIAQPPGFEQPAFIGVQYLQLKDSPSKDLAGYMVVKNNLESLGNMTFYSIPSNSSVKLIGPEVVRTTFIGNDEYNKANDELKSGGNNPIAPTPSDNLLYRIGDYEVYFIPVMINGGEKMGFVGAVGALSTNGTSPYIGLGNTPADAFMNYLQKLPSVPPKDGSVTASNQTAQESLTRIQQLEKVFNKAGLSVVKPTAIYAPLAFKEIQTNYTSESDFAQAEAAINQFIERFMPPQHGRVFEWQNGTSVNFGVLLEVEGIVENHYISIEVGG